jgi:hypothetical protein
VLQPVACSRLPPRAMATVIPVRAVGIEDLPPLQARLCTNSLWFSRQPPFRGPRHLRAGGPAAVQRARIVRQGQQQ